MQLSCQQLIQWNTTATVSYRHTLWPSDGQVQKPADSSSTVTESSTTTTQLSKTYQVLSSIQCVFNDSQGAKILQMKFKDLTGFSRYSVKDHRQTIPRFVIRRYLEKSIQKKLFCHLQSLQIKTIFQEKKRL